MLLRSVRLRRWSIFCWNYQESWNLVFSMQWITIRRVILCFILLTNPAYQISLRNPAFYYKQDAVHYEGRSLEELLRWDPQGCHHEVWIESMVAYIIAAPEEICQAMQATLVWMAWSLHQKDLMDKSWGWEAVAIGQSLSKSVANYRPFCRANTDPVLWKVWKITWCCSRQIDQGSRRFKEVTPWINRSQSRNQACSFRSNRYGLGRERDVSRG